PQTSFLFPTAPILHFRATTSLRFWLSDKPAASRKCAAAERVREHRARVRRSFYPKRSRASWAEDWKGCLELRGCESIQDWQGSVRPDRNRMRPRESP